MTLEAFANAIFAKRDGVGIWELECWILGKRPPTTCAFCKKAISPADHASINGLLRPGIQRYWYHQTCLSLIANKTMMVALLPGGKAFVVLNDEMMVGPSDDT